MTREEAIQELMTHIEHWERLKTERIAPKEEAERTTEAFNMAINALENERPKGHWIRHEHGSWTFVNDKGERGGWIPDYECNLCGSRGWKYADAMNFCPNCGARMKGADDE